MHSTLYLLISDLNQICAESMIFWCDEFNKRHFDKLQYVYTDDCYFLPDGDEVVHGTWKDGMSTEYTYD